MKKWINKQTIISFIVGAILFSGVGVGAASYYQFALSENTLYVNNARVDKSLYIYQNSNYIPLRAAAETLGLDVSVEGKRIDLTDKPTGIEAVAKNAESCVLIRVYSTTDPATAKLVGTASGVVISDGIIVTNKHVLDAGKMYGIQYNNTQTGLDYKTIERYSIDTTLDIGFIKSPVTVKAVKIGDSDKIISGQKIITIGSPIGYKNTVSEGLIASTELREKSDGKYIQASIELKSGTSGGGMFNVNSELIGITTMASNDDKKIGFVVPINDIKPLLEKLK